MKKILNLGFALLVGSFLTSCSEENDEAVSGGFALKVQTETNSSTTLWTIDQAFAYVNEVELEAEIEDEEVEDEDFELEIEGNYEVNLLTGSSNPSLPNVNLQAGTYNELEIELGDDDNGNRALYVEASYDDGTTVYPVQLEVDGEIEFELEDEDGIVLQPDVITQLQVQIALENALAAMDMNSVLTQATPILINSNSNVALYSQFLNALNAEVDD